MYSIVVGSSNVSGLNVKFTGTVQKKKPQKTTLFLALSLYRINPENVLFKFSQEKRAFSIPLNHQVIH